MPQMYLTRWETNYDPDSGRYSWIFRFRFNPTSRVYVLVVGTNSVYAKMQSDATTDDSGPEVAASALNTGNSADLFTTGTYDDGSMMLHLRVFQSGTTLAETDLKGVRFFDSDGNQWTPQSISISNGGWS
jgi:hypothetical protein